MPVYATEDETRFFIVPAEVVVPMGRLRVRALHGERAALDEAALAAYEVSEQEAQARVERYTATLKELAARLEALAQQIRAVGAALTSAQGGEDVDAFLAAVGTDRQELLRDPRAALGRALARLRTLAFEEVEKLGQK